MTDSTLLIWTVASAPLTLSDVGSAKALDPSDFDALILCNRSWRDGKADGETAAAKPRVLCLGCRNGKLGSRDLRAQLPRVAAFVEQLGTRPRIFVACTSADDLSVGVALAILCRYYNEEGTTPLT